MKTRQQKLYFPKLNECTNNGKFLLQQEVSYESILKKTEDKNAIPKLLIMKKSTPKVISISIETDNTTNSKEISFAQLLETLSGNNSNQNNNVDVEIVDINTISTVSKNTYVHKHLELNKNKIIHDGALIKKHIEIISSCCDTVDFSTLYKNFQSNIEFNANKNWNENFAPKSYSSFLTDNVGEISKFKQWLMDWKSKGVKISRCKKSRKDDDSDFEYDSNDDEIVPWKDIPLCVILGPSGAGKTTLVHTIATEMSFKVLEVNCSSKRSGKDVLNKLISATSNQHVKIQSIGAGPSITSTYKKRKTTNHEFSPPYKKIKIPEKLQRNDLQLSVTKDSLMLIDDVDIVMDEDRGFWGAVYNLIETKSRPVVVTCSDSDAARLFLSKLNKMKHLMVRLNPCSQETVIGYLQTILLSQGKIVGKEEMMVWLKRFSNTNLDLRSVLNNLQFDSVISELDYYRAMPEFDDWNNGKVEKMLSTKILVHNELKIKKQSNENLKFLSSMTDCISHVDSFAPKRITQSSNISQRNLNPNRHVESHYDSFIELTHEIKGTLISIYNSCKAKRSEKSDNDGLLNPMAAELELPNLSHAVLSRTKTPTVPLHHIRAGVNGRSDRCDRVSALRLMSISENVRKSRQTRRRFNHYFDRFKQSISESERIYLSTPFKK